MVKLVAFGDSNTRFRFEYTGDPSQPRDAWPGLLETFLRQEGRAVTVENQGFPGEGIAFGRAYFESLARDADGVILAFGTNDIKLPEATLENFLAHLGHILDQNGPRPILVLSIPWMEDGWHFYGDQKRLPTWNRGIANLCREKGADFLDLGPVLNGREELYYDAPKKHLTAEGQRLVALTIWRSGLLKTDF